MNLNIFALIIFMVFILTPGAIWAVATNRPSELLGLTVFIAFLTSMVILFFHSFLSLSNLVWRLYLLCLLGLFVEIFLFRVHNSKGFYEKILWSLVAGLVLAIALLLFLVFTNTQDETLIFSMIFSIIFGILLVCYLVVVSYMGNRFGIFLKRIFPKIYEGFTPSVSVKENFFSKLLRIFWQWIDIYEIKIYEYLMRVFGIHANKDLALNLQTTSGNEHLTTTKEKREKSLEIDHLEKGLTLLLVILISILIFSANNILFRGRYSTNLYQPQVIHQPTLSNLLEGTSTQTPVVVIFSVETIPTSTFEATLTPEPTPTSLPTVSIDNKNVPMVLVPGANMPENELLNNPDLKKLESFTMGSDQGDPDEKPVHEITLNTFYIDQYEVTNSFYRSCVESGNCQPPLKISSWTRPSYYGNSQFGNYPVVYIDWNMAKTYCLWRGARLPTEAEWEKAARGGMDYRTYPWGENIDKSYANYGRNIGDTKAVGSYESGKSIFGAYDMAGNVWEWVADWYIGRYYSELGDLNPIGPLRGDYHVLRGGSWYDSAFHIRAANREYNNVPPDKYYLVGFRCVREFP